MAATIHGYKTVTAAGTAVPLATGSQPVPANWLTIYPRVVSGVSNVGEVRIGGIPTAPATGIPSGSGARLSPGDAAVVWNTPGYFDLREIYVDADNNGDGVQWLGGVV